MKADDLLSKRNMRLFNLGALGLILIAWCVRFYYFAEHDKIVEVDYNSDTVTATVLDADVTYSVSGQAVVDTTTSTATTTTADATTVSTGSTRRNLQTTTTASTNTTATTAAAVAIDSTEEDNIRTVRMEKVYYQDGFWVVLYTLFVFPLLIFVFLMQELQV